MGMMTVLIKSREEEFVGSTAGGLDVDDSGNGGFDFYLWGVGEECIGGRQDQGHQWEGG